MKQRKGVSPFIATVVLVAITLTLGGVLYDQFRQVVTAEVRNPSLTLGNVNVGGDRQTMVIEVKNDGNVQYTVTKVLFAYLSTSERFLVGASSNGTIIAGSATMRPGDYVSVKFTISGVTLPDFSTFTLTVISDQLARAFTVQA